jgi:hypothetical protein
MFQMIVVEKIKTHILCLVTFPPENRAVYETMSKKCGGVREAGENMTHARSVLDK